MTNGKTYGIVHTEIEIHERKCDHEGYFFRHLLHERTTGCFRAGKQLPRSASMAGEAREGTSDRRYGIPGVTGLPGHTSFGDRISQRFLAIYVFSGLTRMDGSQSMPMVRGSDLDSVDILTLQQILVKLILITTLVHSL